MSRYDHIRHAVALAKAEIRADIQAGKVPERVGSFAELHDYVDANCYGGIVEGENVSLLDDIDAINLVQADVDQWLKLGRHHRMVKPENEPEPAGQVVKVWVLVVDGDEVDVEVFGTQGEVYRYLLDNHFGGPGDYRETVEALIEQGLPARWYEREVTLP